MNPISIITLVISSSVLSALLTSIFNIYIQQKNYKRDYFKRIIEKRILAMEEIIVISNELKLLVNYGEGNLCNRIFTNGSDLYDLFFVKLVDTVNHTFWLGSELSEEILNLNLYLLNEVSPQIALVKADENAIDNIIKIGLKHNEKIRQHRKRIDALLLVDFENLHEVDKFMKNQRKQKELLRKIK